MTLAFTFGLALGLMIAGVFALALKGERHINKELREHFDGEEQRNDDSFRAGMRMGHTAAQLDNLAFFPDRHTEPNSGVYADGTTDTGWGGFGGSQHTPELTLAPRSGDAA